MREPLIFPRHIRDHVVQPVLRMLPMCPSPAVAERLLMGTCAVESNFRALKQRPTGPACGLWQVEPATARDTLERVPASVALVLDGLRGRGVPLEMALAGNLLFAAAMARATYYLRPMTLPGDEETWGEAKGYTLHVRLAAIWKRHYNTPKGKGTAAGYLEAWRAYCAPLYPGESIEPSQTLAGGAA